MPKPSDLQLTLLDKLRDADPALEVDWDDARGVARRVRGNLPASTDSLDAAPGALRRFLADFGVLFGPDDPGRTLRAGRLREDDLGWRHVMLQQIVPGGEGLPRGTEYVTVNGGALAAHFAPDGTLTEVQSSCWPAAQRPAVTSSPATRTRRLATGRRPMPSGWHRSSPRSTLTTSARISTSGTTRSPAAGPAGTTTTTRIRLSRPSRSGSSPTSSTRARRPHGR